MRRFLMLGACFALLSGCAIEAVSEEELSEEAIETTSDELTYGVSLRCNESAAWYGAKRDGDCKDSNAGTFVVAP